MTDTYDGPAAFIDAAEAAHLGLIPGFYALDASGKSLLRVGLRKRPVRLVMVDDAPGDANDGACHLEIAQKGDPIARAGKVVALEAKTSGSAEVQS